MTKDSEKLLTKAILMLFGMIVSVTTSVVAYQASDMTASIKSIDKWLAELNSRSLLTEQEFKFKFKWVKSKLDEIEAKLQRIEKP